MDTSDLSHHISRRFNEDLEALRARVMAMGGFVESQLAKAITSLLEGDSSLGQSVALDDLKVNGMEVAIDEECSRILATRSPTAGDLRVVIAIIKTITDLERIGDEAQKIARMGKLILQNERYQVPRFREIRKMSEVAQAMVRRALDAFARLDTAKALEVLKQDDQIDQEFDGLLRKLITYMMEDPRMISSSIDLVFVAKAIERVGDHGKNLAEAIIYVVKGTDVRHSSLEDVENAVR